MDEEDEEERDDDLEKKLGIGLPFYTFLERSLKGDSLFIPRVRSVRMNSRATNEEANISNVNLRDEGTMIFEISLNKRGTKHCARLSSRTMTKKNALTFHCQLTSLTVLFSLLNSSPIVCSVMIHSR